MLIASLLRRKKHLADFLKGIYSINYEPKEYYFLINDAEFNIKDDFLEFINPNNTHYDVINFNSIPDRRTINTRRITYYLLAVLRNIVLLKFYFSEHSHLFFIDSDIIILNPNILNILLAQHKDIISCNIANDYGKGRFTNAMVKIGDDAYKHLPLVNKLTECDLTGACTLFSKNIFKNGYPLYGWDRRGEDISFCKELQKLGIKLYTYPAQNLVIHKMK